MSVWKPVFARCLRGRCPRCGEGRLFASLVKLFEACSVCGHGYRRESGASTGPMYLSAAVTQIFAALVMVALWLWTDWGTAAGLAVAIPVVLVFTFAFFPVSLALWVAIEFMTDAVNGEEWARLTPAPPETNEP